MKRLPNQFLIAVFLLAFQPARALDMRDVSSVFLPFANNEDLFSLRDKPFFFSANRDEEDPTVYLKLQRWDIIFTGDRVDYPDTDYDDSNVNRAIPGPFNHIMVYMGKDARGLAYAVELNTGGFTEEGGIAIICLGSDYGILMDPVETDIVDRDLMNRRWAMRFRPDQLAIIREAEDILLSRIHSDLILGFRYQLELEHSGSALDRYVYLVDDGFENGAGCSDYWTTLFEEYAGICFKNVRMDVETFTEYFLTDPEGIRAYVPPDISPFSFPVTIGSLLGMGFQAVEDEPHTFSCDGTQETGLVLPSLILESELLEEIPAQDLGFALPGFILRP